jgi:hypothetical protein
MKAVDPKIEPFSPGAPSDALQPLGIREGTAKSQVQRIYDKSGTHDRAGLTRWVLSLACSD